VRDGSQLFAASGKNHIKTILTFTLSLVLGVSFASISFGAVKNVVLVHGAFADGSGWKSVADILEHDGYVVYVVQEPETSFAADVAATRVVLDRSGLDTVTAE
jgi:hypothetical protein